MYKLWLSNRQTQLHEYKQRYTYAYTINGKSVAQIALGL